MYLRLMYMHDMIGITNYVLLNLFIVDPVQRGSSVFLGSIPDQPTGHIRSDSAHSLSGADRLEKRRITA